jgi:hypothetical protein
MPSEKEHVLTEHHRFELLDAMRGVAALFVASLHVPPTMQKLLSFQVSYLAVDLFFCLSGFVIAFAYEERLQRGMTLNNFLLARTIRLYPLYFLGLVLGILAMTGRSHFMPHEQGWGGALVPAIAFSLFMLPTLAGRHITSNAYPFDPPAWSLFFELSLCRSRHSPLGTIRSLVRSCRRFIVGYRYLYFLELRKLQYRLLNHSISAGCSESGLFLFRRGVNLQALQEEAGLTAAPKVSGFGGHSRFSGLGVCTWNLLQRHIKALMSTIHRCAGDARLGLRRCHNQSWPQMETTQSDSG